MLQELNTIWKITIFLQLCILAFNDETNLPNNTKTNIKITFSLRVIPVAKRANFHPSSGLQDVILCFIMLRNSDFGKYFQHFSLFVR